MLFFSCRRLYVRKMIEPPGRDKMCFALVFTLQLFTGGTFFLGLNYLSCLNFLIFNYDNFVLLCIHHPSLHPSPTVRPSVRPSVPPSVWLASLNVPTPLMIEFLLVFPRRSVAFSPFPLLFPLLSLLL